MAIDIKKKTDNKKVLKIISVNDSAIDWEASYPEASDLDESSEDLKEGDSELPRVVDVEYQSAVDRKKAHYARHHDETKLKFKTDDLPTLFVFAHPHRADVARKMRAIAGEMYADQQRGKSGKVEKDMFTAVFHHFYLGTEQGFNEQREAPTRVNGRITDDYLQGLEDADVFVELNSAFMRVYNQERSKVSVKEQVAK